MAEKKKDPKVFDVPEVVSGETSDAVLDEVKKQQIMLYFREQGKDLDDLREEKKRVQKENREKRKFEESEADGSEDGKSFKALIDRGLRWSKPGDVRGVMPKSGSKPVKYTDPGDGDLFGEGKVQAGREPWMPTDTTRKDKDGKSATYERGQGKKLSFSDTQPGSSRFVADFETKEFKQNWVRDQMSQRGYDMDGQKSVGYARALREVESTWLKQRSEWLKQKGDYLMGEFREQNKGTKERVVETPVAAPAVQAVQAEDAQTAKGSAALSAPVVKPETVLADGYSYGKSTQTQNGPSYRPVHKTDVSGNVTTVGEESDDGTVRLTGANGQTSPATRENAPWLNGKKTVVSDDGKVSVEAQLAGGQYSNPNVTKSVTNYNAEHPTGSTEPTVGSKVGKSGRYAGNGTIVFGDDKTFDDYKKRGIV